MSAIDWVLLALFFFLEGLWLIGGGARELQEWACGIRRQMKADKT